MNYGAPLNKEHKIWTNYLKLVVFIQLVTTNLYGERVSFNSGRFPSYDAIVDLYNISRIRDLYSVFDRDRPWIKIKQMVTDTAMFW